jgi:AraC-like DNA-binding protein
MTGRRANWPSLVWPGAPAPKVLAGSARGGLTSLLMALDEIRSTEDTDLVLRRAIELARDRIGLKRAGIFVLDPSRNVMLGTWGMDLSCAVVDEHHVIYDLCETDQEALRRAAEEGVHFTVFENCPIIEHQRGETRVAGRGWVAKTPIRSTNGAIGMMFNDAGLTGAPVDEAKQAHAAILCSMLGSMLDPVRGLLGRRVGHPNESPSQALVSSTVEMLNRDPRMGGKEIAAALNISLSRLARVFKTLKGTSLVEYRNNLRLDRFVAMMDRGCTNLLQAAMDSGFGSYAQFHRVFRARLQTTPRDYLRPAIADRRRPASSEKDEPAPPADRVRHPSK